MKIEIDKNNLLTIFNESIPQTKEYTYNVSGYTFSDFDKWIIVLHKKEWKIINVKNLGDNMSVVYTKRWHINNNFWNDEIVDAMRLFQWFDEKTGKKYYFIPWMGDSQQQEKNIMLKKLWIPYTIEKTTKGMLLQSDEALHQEKQEHGLGYLFWLMIMYGKWEEKNKELNAIKIQIPLSGQHLVHEENLDRIIKTVQQQWIFLKADKLANKNGIVYQISSNDYELLEIFAKWYEAVEKFEKITKRDFTQEMKTKLIEFLKTNPEVPSEGKDDVIKQIEEWTIKLLTK